MARRASAAHSPAPIIGILNSADLVSATGVGGQARILAAVLNTGHFDWTVPVNTTFRLWVSFNGRCAKGISVSLQGRPAGANLPVSPSLTPGSLGTGAGRAEGEAILGEPVTALVVSAV